MRSMSTTCPERARRPRGFTLVSVVFLLVVLTALGAALASLSQRQQMGSAMDLAHAQAFQAARAGQEWAAWQLLRNPEPPAAAPACPATTSFTPGGTLADFVVTVRCTRVPGSGTVSDGATALVFYQVSATACNVATAGACPNTSAAPPAAYVERQLSATFQR